MFLTSGIPRSKKNGHVQSNNISHFPMIFSLLLKDFSHWDVPDLYQGPTTKHSLLSSSIAESDFANLCTPISSFPFVTGDGIATPYQRDMSLLGVNISASLCFGAEFIYF